MVAVAAVFMAAVVVAAAVAAPFPDFCKAVVVVAAVVEVAVVVATVVVLAAVVAAMTVALVCPLTLYILHFLYQYYPRSHAAIGFDQLSQMGSSKNRKSLFLNRIQKNQKTFFSQFPDNDAKMHLTRPRVDQ